MVMIGEKSIIQFEKVKETELRSLHEVATLAYYQAYFGSYTYEELKPYLESFFSEKKLMEEMTRSGVDYFLVKKSGRPIGFSQVNHKGSFDQGLRILSEDSVEIFKLYLLQKYTGRGIGTRFMKMMSDYYESNGYKNLYSTVWSLSSKALRFYKKQGYEIDGQIEYEYAGRNNIDYILKKSINSDSDQRP